MSATTRHLTILLTDIKGFTSRTSSASRDDIKRLLDEHKATVLPVLEARGGRLVKAIGDAYLMVFNSPTDAVLAGVEAQAALRRRNAGRPASDAIEIRVVINAGEVSLVGGDVFGEPVNITARLEEVAEAGEVYFTEAVYLSMIKAEVPSQEVGMVQLKGIPEKVKVYKARRAGEDAPGVAPHRPLPAQPVVSAPTQKVPMELRAAPPPPKPEVADPLVGTVLGPCKLEALVGAGGMGAVYKARHLTLERPVAVKLLTSKENAKAQALAEARAAAKLDDPRIVGIHEVGEDAGRPYIVMQWIDGESLESRVARSGPLPPDQALAVMKETLAALAVAHEAGIVHRDVKPGNIMITAKGGVKLADFGLAVSSGGGTDGDPVGTFLFMAPEQGFGQAADARADLYAVGGTWYYALTGKPPFGEDSTNAILRHRDEDPPDVAAVSAGVTRKNADLIRRLMAKAPGERPASAKDALKECSAYGFLLETSALGDSPFQLNAPPPKPAEPRYVPAPVAGAIPGSPHAAAPAPRPAPVAPPPPPPAPAAGTGGSRAMFGVILGVFVLAGVGSSFLKAAAVDWVAASLFLSLLPAALTFGDRLEGWRKPVGALACLGSLACAALYAGVGFSSIEAMALGGLGAACGVAAVYLGLWGQDKAEALYARGLSPAGGLMLAAAAVTWGAPEGKSWGDAVFERGGEFLTVFVAASGPWRWLGVVIMTVAVAVALRMKTPGKKAEPDRKLNWNR